MDKIHLIALSKLLIGTAGGLVAIILCILGLVHISQDIMVSVATLIIGTTLLFKGLVIFIDAPTFFNQLSKMSIEQNELIGGISIELLAAVSSIILGSLALTGNNTDTLIAIAVMINGAAFVIDSSATARVSSLKMTILDTDSATQKISEEMVSAAMAIPVIIGISVIVMGILSLIGYASLTLNLIAILSISSCSLFMGSAITGRMLTMLQLVKISETKKAALKTETETV